MWYKSKTIWSSVVKFGVMAATMFGLDISVEMQAQILAGLVGAGSIIDIIIRNFTDGPISAKK